MKYAKTLGSIALAALLVSGFSGCSENGDVVTGYYLDSAVEGIDYTTADGNSGQTGSDGSFICTSNTTVTFKIGDLVLRTLSGVVDGQRVVETDENVITLLQSIDADGISDNGIQITPEVKTAVVAWLDGATSIDINTTSDKLNNMDALETALTDAGVTEATTVTLEVAQAHVTETITTEATLGTQLIVGDTIHYKDYKGEMREAPLSAAAAEYHAKSGKGETLFDSADKKCQNCHNELYDTWKGSIHAKSWTDPIFQSKFRDFLRTHIAKIGQNADETNTSIGIPYTEAKFKGVAQTCIKCHAPGAYYAGDFNVTLSKIQDANSMSISDLATLKTANETNASVAYDATQPFAVIAVSESNNSVYKATYQIGHSANREGINCAFCHSIETPRMVETDDTYKLAGDMRSGPHGKLIAAKGTTFNHSNSATDPDMNKFFRLWGPEKYKDYANTPKTANFDVNKTKDGRYTMHSIPEHNDTSTHFTGGPYYGPFGVSGKSNENTDDTTDRKALTKTTFDKDSGNHFGDAGKTLCLSCHQRSAGAYDETAGEFMELCSTQMAVTVGDSKITDELDSPKCQKCHMERIEGNLLHQWARPDLAFDATEFETAVGYALTPELDGKDTTIDAGDNPQRDGWFNSHGFLGANKKTGDATASVKKIKSGFSASLDTETLNDTLTVTTTFGNRTGHMFPGAHPMRRALTRVIVTGDNAQGVNEMIAPTSMTGNSGFLLATNTLVHLTDKKPGANQSLTVDVPDNNSIDLNFTAKVPDLNGSSVTSQKFASKEDNGSVGYKPTIFGTDDTVKKQSVTDGRTTGTVFNSAIRDCNASISKNFTRIYGHETGQVYDLNISGVITPTFVVRPGFDSNTVESDNRLSPNETETYTLDYNVSGYTNVSTKYKVYYMQKGANGQFVEDTNASSSSYGWLDQGKSDGLGYIVTEVASFPLPAE